MAAMTSKFYYVCVIQYYTDKWYIDYRDLSFNMADKQSFSMPNVTRQNLNRYILVVGIERRVWMTL